MLGKAISWILPLLIQKGQDSILEWTSGCSICFKDWLFDTFGLKTATGHFFNYLYSISVA